jgi:hypothetical protein
MVGMLGIDMPLPSASLELYQEVRQMGLILFALAGILIIGGMAFLIRRSIRGRKLPIELSL